MQRALGSVVCKSRDKQPAKRARRSNLFISRKEWVNSRQEHSQALRERYTIVLATMKPKETRNKRWKRARLRKNENDDK